MAKAKSSAQSSEVRDDNNSVAIEGIVKKVNYSGDKMMSYNIEVENKTPNCKAAHTWVDVKQFNASCPIEVVFEVGDHVAVGGRLNTESYEKNGKKCYILIIVAEQIKELSSPEKAIK